MKKYKATMIVNEMPTTPESEPNTVEDIKQIIIDSCEEYGIAVKELNLIEE